MVFIPRDICKLAHQLKQGEIGVFPCDTILGIVALATSTQARRIQMIKQRQRMPALVLLPCMEWLSSWAAPLTTMQKKYMTQYWPGPFTFIVNKHADLDPEITSGRPTIALRIPEFLPLNFLLNQVNSPLFSTSVNHHGEQAVSNRDSCSPELLQKFDFFYDAFQAQDHQPSTIVDITGQHPKVIRSGRSEFTP